MNSVGFEMPRKQGNWSRVNPYENPFLKIVGMRESPIFSLTAKGPEFCFLKTASLPEAHGKFADGNETK